MSEPRIDVQECHEGFVRKFYSDGRIEDEIYNIEDDLYRVDLDPNHEIF